MGQRTHKKLRIIHKFKLYKFELDKFDCINILRHEASRHFKNNTKEFLKAKTDELETNSTIKKY